MSKSIGRYDNPPELTLEALVVDIMDWTAQKASVEGCSEAVTAANRSFERIIQARSRLREIHSQMIEYRHFLERSLELCK